MELRAAGLALAVLGLAGSQAVPADGGAAPRLRQLEEAINDIIEEVMQVARDTDEQLKLSELAQELESQARDLSDQLELELEVAPKLRQALNDAVGSVIQVVVLALWMMAPYLDTAAEQTTQVLEQALEQAEALGLDLPRALQAGAKWALELKEQLVGLPPSSP